MRNILLTIAFDGKNYCGFQVQKNAVSVAERVQDAIERVTGVRSDIKGCSRTDSGVHAEMFCISFFTDCALSEEKLCRALDAVLPKDIAALECREVPQDFHARYSCKGKKYRYRIWNGRSKNPFLQGRAYEYFKRCDEEKMDRAARLIEGTRDFSAFMAAGSSVEDRVRTVTQCRCERFGDEIVITVAADGFLYNMVRIIVGTLLWVSEGKIAPEDIPAIIESKDRSKAGPTASAEGLYLSEVYYER